MSTYPIPAVALRDDIALDRIAADDWDRLAVGQPLLSHAFLSALHDTGCAGPRTGWTPRFVTAWRGQALVGALPLYAKTHSYGEYVFDWSWADAYRRYGHAYYPKLVVAIPFTPAPGERVLAPEASTRIALLHHALGMVRESSSGYSSLHVLFPTSEEARECAALGMLIRHGVQFHWENPGYASFDDFLAAFNHDKRKKVKQDRRRLASAGVTFTRSRGAAITPQDWDFFFQCYQSTYHAHGSTAYLSRAFFHRIGKTMADNLLLVQGWREGERICAALDVFDERAMWGRYWGTTQYVPGLHFEACYYQAIEFCIAHRLQRFEGGAQGVHKLARGLLPVTTYSAHAVADPAFRHAIAEFCARERRQVARTVEELEESSPFRQQEEPSLDLSAIRGKLPPREG